MKGCCLLIVFWVVTDAIPVFKKAEWDENKKVTKWEDTKAQNLTFSLAGDSSIEIDLCKLIHCENIGQAKNYAKANVYVCWMPEKPPKKQSITSCLGWDHAMWTTASRDWGYNVPGARASKIKTRFSVKRLRSECTTFDNCNKLLFTLKEPMKTDERLYTIGVWVSGKDPQGTFFLSFPENKIQTGKEFQTQEEKQIEEIETGVIRYTNLSSLDQIALEAGFHGDNVWLEWLRFTVKSLNKENCIVCAEARPQLATVPFPLTKENDPVGFDCIIKLFDKTYTPPGNGTCHTLDLLFPKVKASQLPPTVQIYEGKYTCMELKGDSSYFDYKDLSKSLCVETFSTGLRQPTQMRADIWWLCGDRQIRPFIDPRGKGKCAVIQLIVPLNLLTSRKEPTSRPKRSKQPQGSFDDRIYIDGIGVPRGVPNEFKARNQIAAGFESIIFWWSTIAKNVDWINYIYYNQQRFVNYTRDAIKGIHEQLDATSLMAWQNRMALDMLLAEKGGVCKMFGNQCCTFIPNNTAPDGSITKALEGLTSLSNELAENAGIHDVFTSWLEGWFGRWSGMIMSGIVSITIVAAVLIFGGCCFIPCCRGLLNKTIDKAVNQTMYSLIDKEEYDQLLQVSETLHINDVVDMKDELSVLMTDTEDEESDIE